MSTDRQHIDALLPSGPIWKPVEGGDLDNLLDGMADISRTDREYSLELQFIRDPLRTPFLSDLEREFGVVPRPDIDESIRRNYLAAIKYRKNRFGDIDTLQDQLNQAGFNVLVHANDPAIDPSAFVENAFQMQAGQEVAVCGNENAFCGFVGGELLVNGDIGRIVPNYLCVAGAGVASCGNESAVCGSYENLRNVPYEYFTPENEGRWPLIFFVGGEATRDNNGFIVDIEFAGVDLSRETEFKNLILKFKPMHSWAALLVLFD